MRLFFFYKLSSCDSFIYYCESNGETHMSAFFASCHASSQLVKVWSNVSSQCHGSVLSHSNNPNQAWCCHSGQTIAHGPLRGQIGPRPSHVRQRVAQLSKSSKELALGTPIEHSYSQQNSARVFGVCNPRFSHPGIVSHSPPSRSSQHCSSSLIS